MTRKISAFRELHFQLACTRGHSVPIARRDGYLEAGAQRSRDCGRSLVFMLDFHAGPLSEALARMA